MKKGAMKVAGGKYEERGNGCSTRQALGERQ